MNFLYIKKKKTGIPLHNFYPGILELHACLSPLNVLCMFVFFMVALNTDAF